MALKRIEPGKRMSAAVIHGGMVYLAGFVAEKAAGKSVTEQTRRHSRTDRRDPEGSGHRQDQHRQGQHLAHRHQDLGRDERGWDAWVVPGQTPARATVESKLAAPGLDVEIMVKPVQKPAGRRAAKTSAKKAAKKPAKKAKRK